MPVNLKSMIALVLAMLLPFVPVVLLVVPLDRIWSGIQKLLF
jgi:membrane protein required for beta-lactamase induction